MCYNLDDAENTSESDLAGASINSVHWGDFGLVSPSVNANNNNKSSATVDANTSEDGIYEDVAHEDVAHEDSDNDINKDGAQSDTIHLENET